MKKILLFLTSICLLGSCTPTRAYPDYSESSGFTLSDADSTVLENLDVLGRVWGYVKYHHPVFATDQVDIDYELFGLLPKIVHAESKERNRILYEWIKELGDYESDSTYYNKHFTDSKSAWQTHSKWITAERLDSPLYEALRKMKYAPRKHNRYIRGEMGANNPKLTNEHTNGRVEDCGYRLLLLYRYWNVIEYYCPNRNIADKDWDSVLTEFLPQFIGIKNKDEFWPVYLRLNATLCDGHASGPEYILTGPHLLPVRARYFDKQLIVTDAEQFAPGDELIVIDAVPCSLFAEKMKPYVAASNPVTAAHYTSRLALSSKKDSVDVEYIHAGVRQTKKIATLSPEDYAAFLNTRNSLRHGAFRMLNKSTGYLFAGNYRTSDVKKIMEQLKGSKALIVDLRCYPQEFMIFDFIGRHFIPQATHHVTWGVPIPTMPGLIQYNDNIQLTVGYPDKGHNPEAYNGKIIVLVDETTQSQAEYTAMAFQATPHCTVIGSQTAGADGNVSFIPLPFNMQRIFSGLGVYYPDGTNTQRTGVRVDIEIRPTIEGLREGRDEVLEDAMKIAMQS